MPQPVNANSPEAVGGLIQDMIQKFIKDYILNLKPDLSKLDLVSNKQGFGMWCDSFKPIISGTMDDMAWDAVKTGYNALLDHLVAKQPIPVGAENFTAQDVKNFLATLPGTINPAQAAKLEAHPQLLEALKKINPERAARIVNNPAWLDRLINILVTYGPWAIRVIMIILPFFI